MKTSYEERAEKFLNSTCTSVSIRWLKRDRFYPLDKKERDVYSVRLTRKRSGKTSSLSFQYGQSILDSRPGRMAYPSRHEILVFLAFMMRWRPEGGLGGFAEEYGYGKEDLPDARKAYRTFMRIWKGTERLFGDVLEWLDEME